MIYMQFILVSILFIIIIVLIAIPPPPPSKCPKVVFMVIASDGPHYDAMKEIWIDRWNRRNHHLSDSELWFLYGDGPNNSPCEHDRVYLSVKESLIPGVLDKTMIALREFLDTTDADVVVRTNLSSVYLWERTEAFLCRWRGDVAGLSPDGKHFGGCNFIMSRRAVEWLVRHENLVDRTKIDDVAMSRAFIENGRGLLRINDRVPRYDILDGDRGYASGPRDAIFHIRFKQKDRRRDVDNMRSMF
jgi:hypothetical protein